MNRATIREKLIDGINTGALDGDVVAEAFSAMKRLQISGADLGQIIQESIDGENNLKLRIKKENTVQSQFWPAILVCLTSSQRIAISRILKSPDHAGEPHKAGLTAVESFVQGFGVGDGTTSSTKGRKRKRDEWEVMSLDSSIDDDVCSSSSDNDIVEASSSSTERSDSDSSDSDFDTAPSDQRRLTFSKGYKSKCSFWPLLQNTLWSSHQDKRRWHAPVLFSPHAVKLLKVGESDVADSCWGQYFISQSGSRWALYRLRQEYTEKDESYNSVEWQDRLHRAMKKSELTDGDFLALTDFAVQVFVMKYMTHFKLRGLAATIRLNIGAHKALLGKMPSEFWIALRSEREMQSKSTTEEEEDEEEAPHPDCCICLEMSATVAIIPCGHLTYCDGCQKAMTYTGNLLSCPKCRSVSTGVLKVFF